MIYQVPGTWYTMSNITTGESTYIRTVDQDIDGRKRTAFLLLCSLFQSLQLKRL